MARFFRSNVDLLVRGYCLLASLDKPSTQSVTHVYMYIYNTAGIVFWRTFSHDTIYLIIARFICNDESEFPVAKEIPRSGCVAPCWGLLRNQRGWHSSFIIPNQSKNVMLTRVQVIKFVLWSEDAVIYLLSGYWIISN